MGQDYTAALPVLKDGMSSYSECDSGIFLN